MLSKNIPQIEDNLNSPLEKSIIRVEGIMGRLTTEVYSKVISTLNIDNNQLTILELELQGAQEINEKILNQIVLYISSYMKLVYKIILITIPELSHVGYNELHPEIIKKLYRMQQESKEGIMLLLDRSPLFSSLPNDIKSTLISNGLADSRK